MQKIRRTILFFLLLGAITSHAQNTEVIKNYIDTYKDLAIQEMQRTGVPASITLAQGIHESGAGMSKLALASNNHFGIKCKSNWTGETVRHDDDTKKECFRKYPATEDSYKDHSDFLKNSPRYALLFGLDPEDYIGWANGLKKAGYATNPKYPQVLIKLIEDYQLQEYTLIAMGKQPDKNRSETIESGATEIVPVGSLHAKPKKMNMTVVETVKPTYPDGVFKINETKVVYVKKGISFLAIAKQHDVDLSKVFEFNEIPQAEETAKDQLIYLQRKRKTGNNKLHIVQAGETLHDIAQQEAIRLESLLELNLLKDEDMQPAIGEQLSLQSKSATMPRLALKDNYSISPFIKNKNTN